MSVDSESPRKPRLTRAEARARTRELLLSAAARTFARKGFAGSSVEEIAAEAGFTVGALYSNFAGKEDLFLELMSGRARDRVSDTEEVLAGEYPTAEDMWTALGQQMVDVADKDMDLAPLQAEFWLYAVRHPEVLERYAAMVRRRRAPLERLIGAGSIRAGIATDLAGRAPWWYRRCSRAWCGSGASTRSMFRPSCTARPCAGCSPGWRRVSPGPRRAIACQAARRPMGRSDDRARA